MYSQTTPETRSSFAAALYRMASGALDRFRSNTRFLTFDQAKFFAHAHEEIDSIAKQVIEQTGKEASPKEYYSAVIAALSCENALQFTAQAARYITVDLLVLSGVAAIYNASEPQAVYAQGEGDCIILKTAEQLETGQLEGMGFNIQGLSVTAGTGPQEILELARQLYPGTTDIATYNPNSEILYTLDRLLQLYSTGPPEELEAARATFRSSGTFFLVSDSCPQSEIESLLNGTQITTGYGELQAPTVAETLIGNQDEGNNLIFQSPAAKENPNPAAPSGIGYIITVGVILAGVIGTILYKRFSK